MANYLMHNQPPMSCQFVHPGVSYDSMQTTMNSQPLHPGMNFQPPQQAMGYQSAQPMNFQPVQPMANSQQFQPVMNSQPMINSQPLQQSMGYQSMQMMNSPPTQPMMNSQQVQPVLNSTVMQPALHYQPNIPPMQQMTNSQPTDYKSMQMMNSQSVPPLFNNQQAQPAIYSQSAQQIHYAHQPMHSMMNYLEENQLSSSFNDSSIISVSYNFVLKFVLRSNQLTSLRKGQRCSLNTTAVSPFSIEIDPDCHITFKDSHKWESFDIIYAFVESKDRAFSLEISPQLSFLTPFQLSYVLDEDVAIHCMIIAYPRFSTVDKYQYKNLVELPSVPNVSLNLGDMPCNYNNKNITNFIRKGIIPKLNVDMALEIIEETKTHKCKVLTILCMEYLMKNTSVHNLKKILSVAVHNQPSALLEHCLKDILNYEITLKETKTEKNEVIQKENKAKKNEKEKNEAAKGETLKKEKKMKEN